jgi:hypothetical protein
MSEDLIAQVANEVERITALPLEEQPNAFGLIRDELESVLNGAESSQWCGRRNHR